MRLESIMDLRSQLFVTTFSWLVGGRQGGWELSVIDRSLNLLKMTEIGLVLTYDEFSRRGIGSIDRSIDRSYSVIHSSFNEKREVGSKRTNERTD